MYIYPMLEGLWLHGPIGHSLVGINAFTSNKNLDKADYCCVTLHVELALA